MSSYQQNVNSQYGRDSLSDQIIAALINGGKDIENLTRSDLSTFDEFHIGGLPETRHLVSKIPNWKPDNKVLDIGSGLGGPARTLAAEYGCHVVGLDLTVEFCEAATKLTDLVGLSNQVSFQHGNALEMPFDDNSFDVIWTQFTTMNIEDKQRLYEEYQRVLRPDGYFAFHEVMAGSVEGLVFPVFWADNADINHLQSPEKTQEMLETLGFHKIVWDDLTQYSTDWFQKMLDKPTDQTKLNLGFNIFVGEKTPQKAANIIQNLHEGHITVVQAVYQVKK